MSPLSLVFVAEENLQADEQEGEEESKEDEEEDEEDDEEDEEIECLPLEDSCFGEEGT